jgi:hypothetical protein
VIPLTSKKFCTNCGASNNAVNRVCTQCGSRFPGDNPAAAGTAAPRPPSPATRKIPDGPQTLPALIRQFITGLIKNLPNMVKDMIIGAVISFILVTLLHSILVLLYPDGAGGTDFPGAVLATAGLQSSAMALLFWVLLSAIFAFFFAQVRSRGIRPTGQKLASTPRWIAWSLKNAGISAFPLAMAGVAIAAAIRLLILTPVSSIPFFVLMLGILFSQHESIAVLAMRLGFSDLHIIIRKSGPAIPSEALPVSGIIGAAAGFLLVIFFTDTLLALEIAVGLLVIGSVLALVLRKRANPHIVNALLVFGWFP